MKNYFVFAPDAITVNGHKYAAEYRIISASRVNIIVNYPDCAPGSALIIVEKSDPRFSAVAAAARGEYPDIYITGGDDPSQAVNAPETFEAAAPAPAADDPAPAVNAPETFEAPALELFAARFNKIYDYLYDNYDKAIPGYNDAVAAFDALPPETIQFLRAFVDYRKDFVTSDREAAAFIYALQSFTADAPKTFPAAVLQLPAADDPAQAVNALETFEAAAPAAAAADDPAQAVNAPETFEAPAPAAPAADDPAPVANARKTFDFVGTEIALKYGRILFDAVADRTRVILENADAATIETVKAAGFYYSKVMDSYNKKLTVKAYRAAVALAAQLNN